MTGKRSKSILPKFILIALIVYLFFLLPLSFIILVNSFGPTADLALGKATVFLTTCLGETTKREYSSLVTPYIALMLGGAAFGLRAWKIWAYALLELTIGVYGAGVSLLALYSPTLLPDTPTFKKLSSADNSYSLYIGLVSALFVIVRGLDNLGFSYKRKSREGIAHAACAKSNGLDYLI